MCRDSSKTRWRHNLRSKQTPHTSEETPKLFELTLDTTITKGSFVAVLDDDEDKSYHVAEILSVVNEKVNVHYWGTTTKRLDTARWGPLWTIPGSNKVTRNKPKATNVEERRCTGSFSINKDTGILVILANLGPQVVKSTLTVGKSSKRKDLYTTAREKDPKHGF